MSSEADLELEMDIAYWCNLARRDLQFASRLIERNEEEPLYWLF